MSVQQVDATFTTRTKDLSGGIAAEFLAAFLVGLIDYNNSFEIHEFSFKLSFRTIWLNVEEANKHVAAYIKKVMKCLGETFDIGDDQIQIDFQLEGRDLSKEVAALVIRTGTIKTPTAINQIRQTYPYNT